MRTAPHTQYYKDLQAQLQDPRLHEHLERLKGDHAIFNRYPTPEDLAELFRPGTHGRSDRDEVLRILLIELKTDTALFPLLNYMFWNSLSSIFASKRKSTPNPDELLASILVDFYHTAVDYPLERRPRKIDVNLVLDTHKKVTKWQKEEAQFLEHHEPLDTRLDTFVRPIDFSENTIFPEEMESFLLDLLYRKAINERQFDLLLEVKVYCRMSTKEWAEARGVEYATARSWMARAEEAILEFARK